MSSPNADSENTINSIVCNPAIVANTKTDPELPPAPVAVAEITGELLGIDCLIILAVQNKR